MEGCEYGSIYNSSSQIRKLQLNPKFSYHKGYKVVKYEEVRNYVEVSYIDEKNALKKANFDILLIAAGSVDSTLIVNNSINNDIVDKLALISSIIDYINELNITNNTLNYILLNFGNNITDNMKNSVLLSALKELPNKNIVLLSK